MSNLEVNLDTNLAKALHPIFRQLEKMTNGRYRIPIFNLFGSFLARRRWFAHHDAQSTAFEFEPMKNLFDRMNRRSYIATGASAAVFNSALESEVGSEDELQKLANSLVSDAGDGKSNKLVVSCPQVEVKIRLFLQTLNLVPQRNWN